MVEQGFAALLDQVFLTGEPVTRMSERVVIRRAKAGDLEERFVDFVFQPIRDESGLFPTSSCRVLMSPIVCVQKTIRSF